MLSSIRSLKDFDEGLLYLLNEYFKTRTYSFKDENGKSKSIPIEVIYKKPEGEFKNLEYETSLRVYIEYLDEEPDFRRDFPDEEYIVEEETPTQIKIKLPPKKVDLLYIIGFKTNKMDKCSFLWTELMKCMGDRGCAFICNTPIYYVKSGSRRSDSKEDRVVCRENIYRFKAELDINEAEWFPKVLYYPQIITQLSELNESGEFETLVEEQNDLELADITDLAEEE